MVNIHGFNSNSITGLVMCGGKSARMGVDKSMLIYYDKPQRYRVYEFLERCCENAYISCNSSQVNDILPGYNYLIDDPVYADTGPMAALLTAFKQYPKSNFLLIGCDYPFLTEDDVSLFLTFCHGEAGAAAFYNENEQLYEPLLAYYPNTVADKLLKEYSCGLDSLQKFLQVNEAAKFYPPDIKTLMSIDTYKNYQAIKKLIAYQGE